VLGYKNGYGEETSVPWLVPPDSAERFGRNGSYLVLRQLQQDVAGFWDHFRRQAGTDDPLAAERLAAKAVGRWRNGSPVSQYPDAPGPDRVADPHENDFSFRPQDRFGQSCPLGAHIRRANPRDSFEGERDAILRQVNHHRLLRRGRPYGPRIEDALRFTDDNQERGLVFACLNGNIERQFEFVQHSWCDNARFHGLNNEADPLIGRQPADGGHFSIQGWPVRRRLGGISRFVKVRGGAYFFLPGRAGLVQLAQLQEA
jgi:Dyp-type peroxidase family